MQGVDNAIFMTIFVYKDFIKSFCFIVFKLYIDHSCVTFLSTDINYYSDKVFVLEEEAIFFFKERGKTL